ncbi:hypothetical protein [Burkholderia alba]|uniref:hypothetical protein n=1 Tax=Burkholderia alba TaxID=2683677 RepID=UPI003898E5DD
MTGGGRRLLRMRASGAALPGVLAVTVALLATTAAWFETSLIETRRATGTHGRLIAFRAADAALDACADAYLRRGPASDFATPLPIREPALWRQPGAFDGASAVTPFAAWPGAARPPNCLIERWQVPAKPDARAYLVTARGFGATDATVEWLQLQVLVDDGVVVRRWRRVVGRPDR